MRTLDESKVSGVNQGNEGGRGVEDFFTPRFWKLPISLSASKVAYLVRVGCSYLIKPMVVGFCLRCNWTVGISINVLTDLVFIHYQTALKYTINYNY